MLIVRLGHLSFPQYGLHQCGSKHNYSYYAVVVFQKTFQYGQRAMRQCDQKLFLHQLPSERLAYLSQGYQTTP